MIFDPGSVSRPAGRSRVKEGVGCGAADLRRRPQSPVGKSPRWGSTFRSARGVTVDAEVQARQRIVGADLEGVPQQRAQSAPPSRDRSVASKSPAATGRRRAAPSSDAGRSASGREAGCGDPQRQREADDQGRGAARAMCDAGAAGAAGDHERREPGGHDRGERPPRPSEGRASVPIRRLVHSCLVAVSASRRRRRSTA